MVYVVNDSGKVVAGRSGDNDVFGTGVDMSLRFCFGCIETRAFQNDVYVKFSPGKILSLGASAYAADAYYSGRVDPATGVNNVEVSDADDSAPWYTINGVKLTGKPTAPGIYIHNGKKVVVK